MILTRKIWKYNSEGELRYQRHIDRNEGLILSEDHVGNDEPGVAPPHQEEPIQSDAEVTIIHVWDILYVNSRNIRYIINVKKSLVCCNFIVIEDHTDVDLGAGLVGEAVLAVAMGDGDGHPAVAHPRGELGPGAGVLLSKAIRRDGQ